MKKLIDYIRKHFCKHEWEVEQEEMKLFFDEPVYYKWTRYTCKKCGHFKVHKIKE